MGRGAAGVAPEFDSTSAWPQAIVDQEAAAERLADSENEFEGLGRLKTADHCGHRAEDAGLGACRNRLGVGRGAEQATVAGPAGNNGHDLAAISQDGGVDQRHPGADAGVVEGELDGEVVGGVADDIECANHPGGFSRREPARLGHDLDLGVE